MQKRYDPRQSLAAALARWLKATTRVVLESKAVVVAEWPRGEDLEATADEVVSAAEDYAAAAGRDVLFQVLGYSAEGTVSGSMPLRCKLSSDEGLTSEKVLTAILAQNERLQVTLVDAVKSLTDTSSKMLEQASKRLESVEKERAEAHAKRMSAEQLATDAVAAAEEIVKGRKTGLDRVADFLEKYVAEHGFEKLLSAVATKPAEVPAKTVVDATNHPTEVVNGGE